MRKLIVALAVITLLAVAVVPSFAQSGSIVDIAVADGRFTTLVAAVTAAGLADTLASDGPFTVFAPTDDAFAALPAGTVEALLNDIPALTDILLYHVVSGAVPASTVVTLDSATTLQGSDVSISVSGGNVFLNGNVQVIITDIEASNGIIHVIDAVLLPPAAPAAPAPAPATVTNSIVDIAVADGRFDTLVAAVTAAGLAETLDGPGAFTVFAPTDAAFAKLPAGTVEALLGNIPALTDILLYHVVGGAVPASSVVALNSAETLQGSPVLINVTDAGVVLNGSVNVIITDIRASNGIIHVIDTVLLPPADVDNQFYVWTSDTAVVVEPGGAGTGDVVRQCQTFFVNRLWQNFGFVNAIGSWVNLGSALQVAPDYGQASNPALPGC